MLLRKMRKKMKLIMTITLILVIPAFIWWGVGMRSASKENLVAKVDGAPINLEQFSREYNFLYNRYALLYNDLDSQEFKDKIREMDIEKEALNLLIENIILRKEINKRHIRVSDDEVAQAIKQYPAFLNNDGTFNKQKFEQVLQNISTSQWQSIQEQIRDMLAFEKFKKEIISQFPEDMDPDVAFGKWMETKKNNATITIENMPELTE